MASIAPPANAPQSVDATELARKYLSAVFRTGQMFGAGYVESVLTGQSTERSLMNGHEKLSVWGIVEPAEQALLKPVARALQVRDALRAKGARPPHVLVMTATPIPRTLALTFFGDMDVSVLDELPAGRQPVTTHVVPVDNARWVERTWARVAEEVAAGRQADVVCSRIDPDLE